MDGRIIAAVSNQPHACGHGIQIRQGHAPRREHPAVAVDKGYHRSIKCPFGMRAAMAMIGRTAI